jgi:hypothetical protein
MIFHCHATKAQRDARMPARGGAPGFWPPATKSTKGKALKHWKLAGDGQRATCYAASPIAPPASGLNELENPVPGPLARADIGLARWAGGTPDAQSAKYPPSRRLT